MKRILLIALISLFIFTEKSSAQQTSVYQNNFQTAKYLYDNNILSKLLTLQQLNDTQKNALLLTIYYQASVEDITYEQMAEILSKYFNRNFKNENIETIEGEYAKLIKLAEDLMSKQDWSFLKDQF